MLVSKCEVLGNWNLAIECYYNYDDDVQTLDEIAQGTFVCGVRAVERDPQGHRYQLRALDKNFVMSALLMRMNDLIRDVQDLVGPRENAVDGQVNPLFIRDSEERLYACYGLIAKIQAMSQEQWQEKLFLN